MKPHISVNWGQQEDNPVLLPRGPESFYLLKPRGFLKGGETMTMGACYMKNKGKSLWLLKQSWR